MHIQIFPALGPCATNSYVIVCTETGQAIIIDAPPDSFDVISSYLKKQSYKAAALLLTHSHWDHIAEATLWKEEWKTPIYLHSADLPNLEAPGSDGLPCPLIIPPAKADWVLKDQMYISIAHLTFQVIHTPGHSPGSVCFYEPKNCILFSGDTLFKRSIGNLSFPTSQPTLMQSSLNKFLELPLELQIYPGHGPSTTLQEEISWIPRANKLFGF